ncbi:hypothetical protein HID58_085588 [Brassica napus]|uniref:Uncharacterized protein n=1 Tax=Brassica napus TaxID=3708 RepID=A0ABQ7XN32_BRANA|nr:hypothetical protein HID58_085588 [Brassica napus]
MLGYPTYLKHILFKVRIYKLPNIYQRHGIVRSIGSKLDKLRKFLSLKHEFEMCKESSLLQQRQYELLDIGTNHYMIVQEQSPAIGEYLSTMEKGESSGTTNGLGNSLTIPHFKDIRKPYTPDIMLLTETKHVDSYRLCSFFWNDKVKVLLLDNPNMYCINITLGEKFTWMGKRSKYTIMSRIDSAVANLISFDNRLLLLSTKETKWKKTKIDGTSMEARMCHYSGKRYSLNHQSLRKALALSRSKENTNSKNFINNTKQDI